MWPGTTHARLPPTPSLVLQNDPKMAGMMQAMNDPSYKAKMESAMEQLKGDPELADMLNELEKSGPVAMMK